MKGIVKIEFILGVVVFAVIIFYVAAQINTAFLSINSDTRIDILKTRAVSTLETVMKNSDIGLASDVEIGKLDKAKIILWNDTKVDGICSELNRYNLGGHRMSVKEEGHSGNILFCGFVGLSTIRINVVRSVQIYDGVDTTYGNITLEMW